MNNTNVHSHGNFNHGEGIHLPNLNESLENFCQLQRSTRQAVNDLENVVSDYIEECKERNTDRENMIKLMRDVAILEEAAKNHETKIWALESQTIWLNHLSWQLAEHFKMDVEDMREIYNKASKLTNDHYQKLKYPEQLSYYTPPDETYYDSQLEQMSCGSDTYQSSPSSSSSSSSSDEGSNG